MDTINFTILAAGKGSRLGGSVPKPLTRLSDGRTILEQQLSHIAEIFGEDALQRTTVVVGHRAEEVLAALPPAVRGFRNWGYARSNTAKSLLGPLELTAPGYSTLWLNGDVVFDIEILRSALPSIEAGRSFVVVDKGPTGDEEIKYDLDSRGLISRISKTAVPALGEAVGINHVAAADTALLIDQLREARAQDYFEAAIEATLIYGLDWYPVYAGSSYAVEVDFPEDLLRANRALKEN